MFTDEAAEHFGQVEQELIEVELFSLHDSLAGEEQQLSSEGGCAVDEFLHFSKFQLQMRGEVAVVLEEFYCEHQGGENVVEVMGHAAG